MRKQMLCVLALPALVLGQTINSGSTGADGALNLTTPGTIVFDPTVLNIDADGDSVFHFTTINIGAGVTVRLTNSKLRGRSPVWLATGAVTIVGTLDLDGENGAPIGAAGSALRLPEPGPGGYPGGFGQSPGSSISGTPGAGPGGGHNNVSTNGGPAGHAFAISQFTDASGKTFGAAYGNAVLVPLRGGSGGGGGIWLGTPGQVSGGGGSGGGVIRIFTSSSISVTGTITANGGDGGGLGGPGTSTCCFGGAGSGGGMHLIAATISGTGTLRALGGNLNNNPHGSMGRIRMDAFANTFTGSSNPVASLGSPYNVPLPTNQPTLRVVSIGGINVPPSPSGSSTTPDVTLNTNAPVPIAIEARNVPLGTIVKVNVFSDASGESIINSTALAGTLALSNATATVPPQPGFTRLSVRAVWVP